ncbi:hypothetical protein FB472_1043 [Rhodoglobus vestalii]|uniref:Uncharacterized protein n=1 Tax=Rhodoglobus vestalii TaxID=193384 RepID=A0A8H2KA42_9MICO|nr:hypothetical protein FB472_1043 [Rhodoglobus vestalii]
MDLATLNSTGTASAFELKLSSFQRVLEQAIYNRLSFDRSWIVVANTPNDDNLAVAREYGIGVIVLQDRMRVVALAAKQPRSNRKIRSRLLGRLLGQQKETRVR